MEENGAAGGKERREGREVFQVSGVVDIMYRAFEARFNG